MDCRYYAGSDNNSNVEDKVILNRMNKKLVVIGGGESGTGAAVLGSVKGWDVFVTDKSKIKQKYKDILDENGIEWEEGKHTQEKIEKAELVIKSPGVPETVSVIKDFENKGVPVIDEIEFAAKYTDAKMICITGSNGKTTTTLLTHHILSKSGLDVGLAGNVGFSLAYQVAKGDHDCYVVELSSFQLDRMYEFKADFSVIMNITPDHLDRYDYDINNYISSKFRIVNNMDERGLFAYCGDDPLTVDNLESYNISSERVSFSLKDMDENCFRLEFKDKTIEVSLDDLSLKGIHNVYNSMAASLAAMYVGVDNMVIKQGLSDFEAVEHRLEPVCEIEDILYINDSKATNVNSTWYALESMTRPVVWIAGGTDKGNDYSILDEFVRTKVKALVCMGKDNYKLLETYKDKIENIEEAFSADEAVEKATAMAEKGDVVLLSPCCASFDLFSSYIDRGNKFKESVLKLNK